MRNLIGFGSEAQYRPNMPFVAFTASHFQRTAMSVPRLYSLRHWDSNKLQRMATASATRLVTAHPAAQSTWCVLQKDAPGGLPWGRFIMWHGERQLIRNRRNGGIGSPPSDTTLRRLSTASISIPFTSENPAGFCLRLPLILRVLR